MHPFLIQKFIYTYKLRILISFVITGNELEYFNRIFECLPERDPLEESKNHRLLQLQVLVDEM